MKQNHNLNKKPELSPNSKREVVLAEQLETTTKVIDKNPYIIARKEILSKKKDWEVEEILNFELNKDLNNRFYLNFVEEVSRLGDKLSNN